MRGEGVRVEGGGGGGKHYLPPPLAMYCPEPLNLLLQSSFHFVKRILAFYKTYCG